MAINPTLSTKKQFIRLTLLKLKIIESTIIFTTVLLYSSKFVSPLPFKDHNSDDKAQPNNNEKNENGPAILDLINELRNEQRLQQIQQQQQQHQIEPLYYVPIELTPDHESLKADYNNENADLNSISLENVAPLNKRAQTFVRFGKRAQTFVRFGKRAQTFVRFG